VTNEPVQCLVAYGEVFGDGDCSGFAYPRNGGPVSPDAVQRSLAITKGKVTEDIVPYLPGFDLEPQGHSFSWYAD
jgi:hypothetical protein